MNRWGHAAADPRGGRAARGVGGATTRMQHQWQMTLLWGICVGTGTGVDLDGARGSGGDALVRDAARAVLGALSAANATGQLVFLPLLARVVQNQGWRSAALMSPGPP